VNRIQNQIRHERNFWRKVNQLNKACKFLNVMTLANILELLDSGAEWHEIKEEAKEHYQLWYLFVNPKSYKERRHLTRRRQSIERKRFTYFGRKP